MSRTYGVGPYGAGLYGGGSLATLAAKLKTFGADPIILLEIELSDGTRYYATHQSRFSTANYDGKIMSIGPLTRTMQNNLGIYETSAIEVILADTDNGIFALNQTKRFKGVMARLKIGDKSTALTDYFTLYQGRIDDYGAQEFGFRVVIQDHIWTLPQNPDTGFITDALFPYALPAHKGKPIPVCYGTHFDDGTTADGSTNDYRNAGAWPALFIDVRSANRRYLIAGHAIKSIDNVYATTPGRGTLSLVSGVDYLPFTAGFFGGKRYAYIEIIGTAFTDKIVDTAGNLGEVTVNVKGKTTAEDGTGLLITNPIDILSDILNLYLGGPPLNATKFSQAQAVANSRAYVTAGGYINEKGTDIFLKELLDSFNIRMFPTFEGDIAVDIYEPSGPADTVKSIIEGRDVLENTWNVDFQSAVQGAEDAKVINEVNFLSNFHWRNGSFRKTATSSDSTSIATYGSKKLNLPLPWSGNLGSAQDVAYRYVALYRNPVAHINFKAPLLALDIDLSDQILASHANAPFTSGYVSRRFEIISKIFNSSDFSNDLRARDVEVISQNGYFLDNETSRVRVSDGTVGVTNGSGVITATGATSFITAGVAVDDIIRIKTVTNEGNRKNLKVTAVTATTVTVSNTVWTNETGMGYEIIRSWLTQSGTQGLYGHLCNESTGLFSDAGSGFRLL